MEEIKLRKLHETESKEQATLLKAVLEQEGLKVILEGMGGSALGDAFDGADVVDILVPEAHLEKAMGILDEIVAAGEETIPAWSCDCGEAVDEGFFVCWSCQAEYKPDGKSDGKPDADASQSDQETGQQDDASESPNQAED